MPYKDKSLIKEQSLKCNGKPVSREILYTWKPFILMNPLQNLYDNAKSLVTGNPVYKGKLPVKGNPLYWEIRSTAKSCMNVRRFAQPLPERSRKSESSVQVLVRVRVYGSQHKAIHDWARWSRRNTKQWIIDPGEAVATQNNVHNYSRRDGRVRQICATAPGAVAQICGTRPVRVYGYGYTGRNTKQYMIDPGKAVATQCNT